MLEIPGAVDGVAVEHGADDLLVAQDDALVDAAVGVLQHDVLLVRRRREIAGGEQVDAGHLQLGRDHRAVIGGKALHGEVIGADLGLIEQRRDQAVGLAAVLHAFADRIDAAVIGLHGVGDDDAALAMKAGLPGELDIRAGCRPPSRRGRPEARCRPSKRTPVTRSSPRIASVCAGILNTMPRSSSDLRSSPPATGSSWRSISASSRWTTVTFMPRFIKPLAASRPSRPPPITTALRSAARGLDHALDVVDVAEADHAGQVLARQRQHDRIGAGRDQQAVIGHAIAGLGDDLAGAAVDHGDRLALAQRDVVVVVPFARC